MKWISQFSIGRLISTAKEESKRISHEISNNTVICVRAMPLARYHFHPEWHCTCTCTGATAIKTFGNSAGGERLKREVAKVVCTCSLGVNPCMPCNSAGASRRRIANQGRLNLFLSVFFITSYKKHTWFLIQRCRNIYLFAFYTVLFSPKTTVRFSYILFSHTRFTFRAQSISFILSKVIISVEFALCNNADWTQMRLSC